MCLAVVHAQSQVSAEVYLCVAAEAAPTADPNTSTSSIFLQTPAFSNRPANLTQSTQTALPIVLQGVATTYRQLCCGLKVMHILITADLDIAAHAAILGDPILQLMLQLSLQHPFCVV